MGTAQVPQSPVTWYAATGCGGQGLVIEERTGRNVAVAYDEKDMHLLAAAPELLAELAQAELVIRHAAQESAGRVKAEIVGGWVYHADKARAALAKVKGE